jgi:hypothetical protein
MSSSSNIRPYTINAPLKVTNSSTSTSKTTGATIITGGLGVSGPTFINSLNTDGTVTLSGLTLSTSLALDASKNIVSIANTGSGNNVLAASPIFTGTITSSSITASGILSITNSTVSTSSVNGALVVAGGVGIGEKLNVLGATVVSNILTINDSFNLKNSVSNGGETLTRQYSYMVSSNVSSSAVATTSYYCPSLIIKASGNSGTSLWAPGFVPTHYAGDLTLEGGDLNDGSNNGTASVNKFPGSIHIKGGVGWAGLNGNSVQTNGSIIFSVGVTSATQNDSGKYEAMRVSPGGIVNISTTTASTSTTTGALTVAGGLGVAGAIYSGTKIQFSSIPLIKKIVLYDDNNNDHQFSGFGLENNWLRYQVPNTAVDNVFFAGTSSSTSNEIFRIKGTGDVQVKGTTASTSTGTGALTVAGGIGVAGNINVGGTVTGIQGSTPSFNSGLTLASSYNMVLTGNNDTGTKLVVFVSGSTKSDDGGINSATIRNDAGLLILGNASFGTVIPSPLTVSGSSVFNGPLSVSPTGNGVFLGIQGTYASIQLNNTDGGYIDFATSGADFNGRIIYTHTSHLMEFQTNGSVRLNLNSTKVGVLQTTASTSTTTGALTVAGGVGVAGAIYANTIVATSSLTLPNTVVTNAGNTFVNSSSSDGQLIIGYNQPKAAGEVGIFQIYNNTTDKNTLISAISKGTGSGTDRISIPITTASTSSTTGALVVSGGIGVAGSIFGTKLSLSSATLPLYVVANSSTDPYINGILCTNQTNSANNHSVICIRNGGASGGNPYLGYDIFGVTGWSTGIDNSDSQKFKIKSTYNFTGTEVLTATTAGVITIPSTAASTSSTTGALVVSGGLGVAGVINSFGGAKLSIQNSVDGGNSRGIFMWSSADTNWGIYMASPGASKSLAGGTAVTGGIGGALSTHCIRFRCNATSVGGFIFENSAEQLAVSISGYGDMYLPNGTASTSKTTGTLVVGGGVGVAGTINAGVISTTGDLTGNEVYSNNWLRTSGTNGWYNSTYDGGIHMTDSTYVRTYNGKGFSTGTSTIVCGNINSSGTVSAPAVTASGNVGGGSISTTGNITASGIIKVGGDWGRNDRITSNGDISALGMLYTQNFGTGWRNLTGNGGIVMPDGNTIATTGDKDFVVNGGGISSNEYIRATGTWNNDRSPTGPGVITAYAGYVSKAGATGGFGDNVWNFHWETSALAVWIDTSRIGTINVTSDYRIKQNITNLEVDALSVINQIRCVNYEITDYKMFSQQFDGNGANIVHQGFIAHELKELVSDFVSGEKDEENVIQTINPLPLISYNVKAIQEMHALILEQQQLIIALSARVANLESA